MKQYESENAQGDITILVVEDDQSLNRMYKSHLVQQHFRVITSLNYDEAMIVLASEPIDIALVDYDLGDRKGLDLIKNLPEKIKQKAIPVIVMGSNENPQILQACMDMGVDDYILKPINAMLLNLKVSSLIYHVRMSSIIAAQNQKLTELITKADLEKQMVSHIMDNHLLSRETTKIAGLEFFLQPTEDFSGDIIVAHYAPSGSIFILHADATGHGLSATVTLMPIVSIFKAMVEKGYRLESIIREINATLSEQLPVDRFVAASMVEVDLNHQVLRVWNGGMPSLWLFDDQHNIIQYFSSKYMALGILAPSQFESRAETIKLPDKARLVSFSDAVVDQRDVLGYAFGMSRLMSLLRQWHKNSLNHILQALIEHTGHYQFDDDLSMYQLSLQQAVEAQKALYLSKPIIHSLDDIAPFTWSLELVGKQIAKQELPSQCNQFLMGMGFHHSMCQRVFTIISELVNNAVDHGLLKLTSILKSGAEGFLAYYQERDIRLTQLSSADHLKILMTWFADEQGPCLLLEVKDSGEGYLLEDAVLKDPATEKEYGRGLSLVKQLATHISLKEKGTHVSVMLR